MVSKLRTAKAPPHAGGAALAQHGVIGMGSGAIDKALERLVSPPPLVVAALDQLHRRAPDWSAVETAVARCPALTMHVLRHANTAEWSVKTGRITSALRRLGHVRTRELCASLVPAEGARWDPVRYDATSLELLTLANRQARTAMLLARIRPIPDKDGARSAYVAALLAGIGLLVMKEVGGLDGRPYGCRLGHAWEEERFGVNHAELGEWIARRCFLPSEIARAIGSHSDEEPPNDPLGRIVWLSVRMMRAIERPHEAIESAVKAGFTREQAELFLFEFALGTDQVPMFSGLRSPCPLTATELDYIGLVVANHTSKEIGEMVGRTTKAIDNTLAKAYAKLDVSGRTQAAMKCWQQGWA